MNGNAWEWTERLWNAGARGVKGGSWSSVDNRLLRTFEGIQQPTTTINQIGFRVASSLSSPMFSYVTISDINNSNDDSGIGSVSYQFTLNKFLITNNEYAEFLNSIASTDLYGVYSTNMSSDRGGINRSGTNEAYTYSVKPNYGNKPVVFINWYNAARYCNWLHNGRPSGSQNNSTTENGSYQLTGNTNSPTRQIGALYFIPNGDEWQKAAFYKGGSTNAGYWNYSTQNNTVPSCVSSDSVGNGI
jgi:formylglycine-generating enzyme required for sulfatase activity